MLTQAQLIAKYGDPGVTCSEPDPAWVKANIITRQGKRAFPGVPAKWYFMCHRLVEDRLQAGFAAALAACPEYKITSAASFVFRHMRHDIRAPLSWHSLGVAVDVDAPKNAARTFDAGKQPKPWSKEWMRLWPDCMPQPFVEAMEAQGWEWGGRWRGFLDLMHFQVRQ